MCCCSFDLVVVRFVWLFVLIVVVRFVLLFILIVVVLLIWLEVVVRLIVEGWFLCCFFDCCWINSY